MSPELGFAVRIDVVKKIKQLKKKKDMSRSAERERKKQRMFVHAQTEET